MTVFASILLMNFFLLGNSHRVLCTARAHTHTHTAVYSEKHSSSISRVLQWIDAPVSAAPDEPQ